MTKSPKQLADEMAKKCSERIASMPCFNSPRWTPQTKVEIGIIQIQESIPLLELLTLARAVKNVSANRAGKSLLDQVFTELYPALAEVEKKVEL